MALNTLTSRFTVLALTEDVTAPRFLAFCPASAPAASAAASLSRFGDEEWNLRDKDVDECGLQAEASRFRDQLLSQCLRYRVQKCLGFFF